MTAEYNLYKSCTQKMEDFCMEAELDCVVYCDKYPLSMVVRKTNPPQMSLLDLQSASDPDQSKPNPNAFMRFTLVDGEIHYSVSGGFSISEGTLNKLKGFFKKITDYYLQHFFRGIVTGDERTLLLDAISNPVSPDNE